MIFIFLLFMLWVLQHTPSITNSLYSSFHLISVVHSCDIGRLWGEGKCRGNVYNRKWVTYPSTSRIPKAFKQVSKYAIV